MTIFYYSIGSILLGAGAWYNSLAILFIGFYFFANTTIGKWLDSADSWYLTFTFIHVLYAVGLLLTKNTYLTISGIGFLLGTILILLTYLGWSRGDRLFAYFDVATIAVIIAPIPFYLYLGSSKIS